MTDLSKYDERIQKLERRELSVQLLLGAIAVILGLAAITQTFPTAIVTLMLFFLGCAIGTLLGPKFLR